MWEENMSVPNMGKVLPDNRNVNRGTWRKGTAFWNETSPMFAIRPGADMSLILMHFYVSPVVQCDVIQMKYLSGSLCIKVSGCCQETDASWRSWVIYDLFVILNIKVSYFIRISLLSQSWISLPCWPFAVAVYLLLLRISMHLYIYRHFCSIFA